MILALMLVLNFFSGEATKFRVRYYAVNLIKRHNHSQDTSERVFTVGPLTPSTLYTIDVMAYNKLGYSEYSAPLNATTSMGSYRTFFPKILKFKKILGQFSLRLKWQHWHPLYATDSASNFATRGQKLVLLTH